MSPFEWTKSCEAGQKTKVQGHSKMLFERLPAPTRQFSHVVGPLNPACEGKNTLHTMHGEAANAKACAKVLVHQWIARWGMPDIITSDHGSQFLSDLWLEVCNLMGIARDPTTSYHHQDNGKVKRMHRCLKNYAPVYADCVLRQTLTPVSLRSQLVVQRANIDNASVFG